MIATGTRRGTATAWLVAAGVLVTTFACSGSGSPSSAPAGTATPATAPAGASNAYQPTACPFDASGPVKIDCGLLTVPQRHDRAGGTSPRIAVAILHSTGGHPAADPLVYLEGGPGGSALAEFDLWTDPVSPLLADRDVILVDPRGTGYSTPRLTCDPEFNDPTNDTVPQEELTKRCHDRLGGTGVDFDAYSTTETAADIQDLRRALGFKTWNVMGVSYGTRLALEVLRRETDGGVRSVVLDSAYPADIDSLDTQPANAYRALHALLEDCRADAACANAFPDLEARLLDTVEKLNAKPVTVQRPANDLNPAGPYDIDGDELVRELFDALYISSVIPDIPLAIDAAARGDVQRADDLLASSPPAPTPGTGTGTGSPDAGSPDASAPPDPSNTPPSDSDGLFLNIECAEDAPRSTAAALTKDSAAVPAPIAAPLVDDVNNELGLCRSWPVGPQRLTAVTSSPPTLILAGSYDPITPPEWGRLAAKTLATSRVVELAGAGHGVIDAGDCPAQLIVSFLRQPADVTRPDAPTCTARPAFNTH